MTLLAGPDRAAFAMLRLGYLLLGLAMLALGFIGALLPVMPTTVFLIVAAWCFGKSSPRLEAWLLRHPVFGDVLRAWRENGAIPRRAKYFACSGIAAGYAIFYLGARPGVLLGVGVALFMLGSALWIITRPETGRAATQRRD